MIISKRRLEIVNGIVEIPRWARAPLSLSLGSKCYLLPKPQKNDRYSELILSPFEPDHWPDVWRIEIETNDKIGIYSGIFETFARMNIKILASEGSVSNNDNLHFMSFFVSCKDYSSNLDKDTMTRRLQRYFELTDLYEVIAVKFIDSLIFADNGRPRLKIRRVDAYNRVWRHMQDDKEISPRSIVITRKGFRLPEDILLNAMNVYPEGAKQLESSAFSMMAVDTKDRLLRIIKYRSGTHMPFYLQVGLINDPKSIARVFDILKSFNCNVIKHQIRRGISKHYKNPILRSQVSKSCRLDLTFVSDFLQDPENFTKAVAAAMKEDDLLKISGCEISDTGGAR